MTHPSVRRRVLLSRETLQGLGVVLLAAAVCVALGLWQYGRFEDKREAAAIIRSHQQAEPVALDAALPAPDSPLPAEDEWTRVTLEGRYCTAEDCVLYVRNRTLSGEVGFWQLAPFVADDGITLLVVRGWVPAQESASAPADPPPVPTGEQTLEVRLRPAESALPQRSDPPGQVQTVTPADIAGRLPAGDAAVPTGSVVEGAYGEMRAESPGGPAPRALPDPETSLGPHLSYAFQWWIFALFFPAALVYRTRKVIAEEREAEEDAAARSTAASGAAPSGAPEDDGADAAGTGTPDAARGDGAASAPAGDRPPRRAAAPGRPRRALRPEQQTARRRGHDEEEEDALIDQQHR